MKASAIVLEGIGDICLRDTEVPGTQESADSEVRIAVKAVGTCGADLHYYKHGRIGDFVVNGPMILGDEAAGVVTAADAIDAHLEVGDRVGMEPDIPDFGWRGTFGGRYNLDPSVRVGTTSPIHGCLTPEAVQLAPPPSIESMRGAAESGERLTQ